jgi:asparagine synthase (glutamine-hydrolysing)
MCGICGTYRTGERATVERMVARLAHRGPDDHGVFSDGRASLAMARLAILDLSDAGHQPMATPDELIWIVYNGELYNFREERALLESEGVEFHSGSDTEVVLRMYERYGDDLVTRLRGMFALAIYDRRGGEGRQRLLLARDHFGIKPLLYARRDGGLIFASELRALLGSGLVEPAIDMAAIRELLTLGAIQQPRTMIRDVAMLPPAHRMIIDHWGERIERYWSLEVDRIEGLRSRPYPELVERLGATIEESLRLQMVSDVPLGAFLSGGVDSSLLVALMRRAIGHQINTFSVGYGSEGAEFDESDDARTMAAHLDTVHTAVTVSGGQVRDEIERFAESLDQPSVDGLNTYFVSLAARRSVTVAISGTGGDELFAGYPWFISMVLAEARGARGARSARSSARELVASLARSSVLDRFAAGPLGPRLASIRKTSSFLSRYAVRNLVLDVVDAARLIAPSHRAAALAGRSLLREMRAIDELANEPALERVTALTLRGYLGSQLLRDVDVTSMAHSLEVRVPFLDPVVADVALSLPLEAKLGSTETLASRGGDTYRDTGAKRILIDVAKRYLPPDFDRQPKRGFTMPIGAWLGAELADVVDDTLSPASIERRGLFDSTEVDRLRREFAAGRLGWQLIWLLVIIELWCRLVLDTRGAGAERSSSRAVAEKVQGAPGGR